MRVPFCRRCRSIRIVMLFFAWWRKAGNALGPQKTSNWTCSQGHSTPGCPSEGAWHEPSSQCASAGEQSRRRASCCNSPWSRRVAARALSCASTCAPAWPDAADFPSDLERKPSQRIPSVANGPPRPPPPPSCPPQLVAAGVVATALVAPALVPTSADAGRVPIVRSWSCCCCFRCCCCC